MTIGTVRTNRKGMPARLKTLKLPKGESAYQRQSAMVAIKWQDKRDVTILSTVHDPREKVTCQTRTATTDKPAAVADYTQNMCGVDKSDQMMAYMPLQRRSVKWWKKVFVHLFVLTVVQCQILYNKCRVRDNKPKVKLNDFVLELGKSLTKEYFSLPDVKHPSSNGGRKAQLAGRLDRITESRHFMYPLPIPEEKQNPNKKEEKLRRRCLVCQKKFRAANPGSKKYTGQMTYFWCQLCEAPLCHGLCFELFHTIEK